MPGHSGSHICSQSVIEVNDAMHAARTVWQARTSVVKSDLTLFVREFRLLGGDWLPAVIRTPPTCNARDHPESPR